MRKDVLDALVMIGAAVLSALIAIYGIPSLIVWWANRKRRSE